MAPNVTAAAAHIAYDMQPPESLHRTKYQIKAKKNQDLEHTELEMLITMNVHIPLPKHDAHSSNSIKQIKTTSKFLIKRHGGAIKKNNHALDGLICVKKLPKS